MTHYKQLHRVLECRTELEHLKRYSKDADLVEMIPDYSGFARLMHYEKLLAPIDAAITILEGDGHTLSLAPELLHNLIEQELNRFRCPYELEPLRRQLVSILRERVAEIYTEVGLSLGCCL